MKRLTKPRKIITYPLVIFFGVISIIFFRCLNKTQVRGIRIRRPGLKNLLIVSNHRTMIDSFLVAPILFWPEVILHPSLVPFHTAARENFFEPKLVKPILLNKLIVNPFISFLFTHLKCIPVKKGRIDSDCLRTITRTLPTSTFHIFPEGTRSRNGKLGEGREGLGKVIYDVQPLIISVYIAGMENVLPLGTWLPHLGKKITVTIGKPFNCREFQTEPNKRRTWKKITEKVMKEIAELVPSEQT